MCGYSTVWNPVSNVCDPTDASALTTYCPSGVFAPGRNMKRTVCASSSRVKFTGCAGGVDAPSRQARPAAPRRSVALLAVVRHGDAHFAIDGGGRSAAGRHDRDRRRDPQREPRHDRQLHPLLAFELLALRSGIRPAGRTCSSVPSAVSVIDARNGVGRNGRPNGASGSNS